VLKIRLIFCCIKFKSSYKELELEFDGMPYSVVEISKNIDYRSLGAICTNKIIEKEIFKVVLIINKISLTYSLETTFKFLANKYIC